jgi:B12-binding domain/radical SAM domain protein of rhizo-twelve system
MKIALVNPPWSFDGSIYFGCHDPHLPLEYGYSKALLERDGHEVEIVDAQLEGLSKEDVRRRVESLAPQMTVVTTTPSYLFWRCPPPELRVPKELLGALGEVGGAKIVVGPHGSTSPETTLRKLGADAVVRGECEEVLVSLAKTPREGWGSIGSLALPGDGGRVLVTGGPHASDMAALPALSWPAEILARHRHHHHRFDATPVGPGAEMEASRGCPYSCTFCAKDNYRDKYRKRPLATVIQELDDLISKGVEYIYFIDEILLPDKALLEALEARPVKFGIQTRIDLWSFELLDLLGRAGCLSIEAGVESITVEGRALLNKRCKLDTDSLTARLVHAKKSVPFVQATLMESKTDDPAAVAAWRDEIRSHGVWANDPVPLFPYPGSPDYTRLWGSPDERAWERAHDHYLAQFDRLSDIQDRKVVRLPVLEGAGA